MLHGEGSHVLYHRNLIKLIRQNQTITWQVTCKKLLIGKIKTKDKNPVISSSVPKIQLNKQFSSFSTYKPIALYITVMYLIKQSS